MRPFITALMVVCRGRRFVRALRVGMCLTSLLWIAAMLSVAFATSPGDDEHCAMSPSLRRRLVRLDCDTFASPSLCAEQARRLAQEHSSGTWAAIVLRDIDAVGRNETYWRWQSVGPSPFFCRVLTSSDWLIEVFRTGHDEKALSNDQFGWISRQALLSGAPPSAVDLCPLPFLKAFIESSDIVDVRADVIEWQRLVDRELGGDWTVLVAHFVNTPLPEVLGFNFPHYVRDSVGGFCIARTHNGWYVNVAKVGYESSREESFALGF